MVEIHVTLKLANENTVALLAQELLDSDAMHPMSGSPWEAALQRWPDAKAATRDLARLVEDHAFTDLTWIKEREPAAWDLAVVLVVYLWSDRCAWRHLSEPDAIFQRMVKRYEVFRESTPKRLHPSLRQVTAHLLGEMMFPFDKTRQALGFAGDPQLRQAAEQGKRLMRNANYDHTVLLWRDRLCDAARGVT